MVPRLQQIELFLRNQRKRISWAEKLICVKGQTPEPCGTCDACDACVDITEGRVIDVLEIDMATHAQAQNVRDVIIAGPEPIQGLHH